MKRKREMTCYFGFCTSRMHVCRIIYLKNLAVIYATKYRIQYFICRIEFWAHTWRFSRVVHWRSLSLSQTIEKKHTKAILFICTPRFSTHFILIALLLLLLLVLFSMLRVCTSFVVFKYLAHTTNEDKQSNRTRSETLILHTHTKHTMNGEKKPNQTQKTLCAPQMKSLWSDKSIV